MLKYQMLLNSRKFNKKLLSCDIGMPGYIDDMERYKRYEPSEGEKIKIPSFSAIQFED